MDYISMVNKANFDENFIVNYKEKDNNIYFEVGIQKDDNIISKYQFELINYKEIYTRNGIWWPYKTMEENIQEIDNTPYKKIPSLTKIINIDKDNIVNSIHISVLENKLLCIDLTMDWSTSQYKIIFEDIRFNIIKNTSEN